MGVSVLPWAETWKAKVYYFKTPTSLGDSRWQSMTWWLQSVIVLITVCLQFKLGCRISLVFGHDDRNTVCHYGVGQYACFLRRQITLSRLQPDRASPLATLCQQQNSCHWVLSSHTEGTLKLLPEGPACTFFQTGIKQASLTSWFAGFPPLFETSSWTKWQDQCETQHSQICQSTA